MEHKKAVKCHSCKSSIKGSDYSYWEFLGEVYCYLCLEDYIHEELIDDAVEQYIINNMKEIR